MKPTLASCRKILHSGRCYLASSDLPAFGWRQMCRPVSILSMQIDFIDYNNQTILICCRLCCAYNESKCVYHNGAIRSSFGDLQVVKGTIQDHNHTVELFSGCDLRHLFVHFKCVLKYMYCRFNKHHIGAEGRPIIMAETTNIMASRVCFMKSNWRHYAVPVTASML